MRVSGGLRTRFLFLLGSAFGALLVAAVYHLSVMRTDALRQGREAVLNAAQLLAAAEAVRLERAHALLHSLLPLPLIREAASTGGRCQQLLSAALAHSTGIDDLFVTRTDGTIVCAAKATGKRSLRFNEPYLQDAAVAHEHVLGRPRTNFGNRELVVPLAEPILGHGRRVNGVLTAFTDLSWLRRHGARRELPANSVAALFDSQGRVVLQVPAPDGGAANLALPSLATAARATQRGVVDVSLGDGVSRLYAFVPLMHTISGTYFIGVGVPRHSLIAAANGAFLVGATVVFAILAVTFGVIWYWGERLVLRRVFALCHAAQQLAEGNLAARSGLPSANDELGSLVRCFDRMAAGLQERQGQLEAANRHLERTNCALRVLSGGNRAVIGITDEKHLLDEICRVLVEVGGYRMAWVGFTEGGDPAWIRPAAQRGVAPRYFEHLQRIRADAGPNCIPSTGAVCAQSPVVVKNVMTEPGLESWRELATELGYESTLALPLTIDNQVLGALVVYAHAADAFGAEEVTLLAETAEDLAFGIKTLRARTERTRLEASLRRTEDQLRAAAQGSLDAFYILHPKFDANGAVTDLRCVEANAKTEALLGVSRNDLTGRNLGEVLPSLFAQVFPSYLSTLATGKALEEQFALQTASGTSIWVRHQVVPLAKGVAVFARDITDAVASARKIRRSEKRYRELLESLQEGIYLIDADCRTTFVNRRMAAMLGYSVEEMLDRPVFDFVPESERASLKTQLNRGSQGERASYELQWRRKLGESVYTQIEGCPIYDDAGGFVGSLAAVTDVTDRRRSERALARANRALATLGAVNEELVRADGETQLLWAVCRAIVEHGGYAIAWVGYAEDDTAKSIRPRAWAGAEPSYFERLRLSWSEDAPAAKGAVGRAIRSGRPQVTDDILTDPNFGVSRDVAIALGSRSHLALPLTDGEGRSFGFLSIHGCEAGVAEQERVLLRQLAEDLSYGIRAIRAKAERDRIAYDHLHHAEILKGRLMESIEAISATVEMRDPYTAGHQIRVASLGVALAREVGLSDDKVEGIHLAGIVHDLGKISVPAEILNKPGRLTDIEFSIIKQHAEAGYDILKNIEFPWPIAEIVRQHHERLDGTGYPQALKDGAILPEARILAVADTVEAMASHRPYRPSRGIEPALAEIERGSGTAYDAHVVEACVRLFREGRFAFEGGQDWSDRSTDHANVAPLLKSVCRPSSATGSEVL